MQPYKIYDYCVNYSVFHTGKNYIKKVISIGTLPLSHYHYYYKKRENMTQVEMDAFTVYLLSWKVNAKVF